MSARTRFARWTRGADRAIWIAALLVVYVAHVSAATPSLHGIAVDETLDVPSVLTDIVPAGAGANVPLVVRLTIDPAAFRDAGGLSAVDRLDVRVALYRARHISIVLALGKFPNTDEEDESWLSSVRTIVEHERGHVAAYQLGDASVTPLPEAARYAYRLKQTALQVRSIDGDALIVLGSIPVAETAWLSRIYAEGVAPYSDMVAIAVPSGVDMNNDALRAQIEAMSAMVTREAPAASIVLGPFGLSDQPAAAAEQLVSAGLRALGTNVSVTTFHTGVASLTAALAAAARLTDLLSGDVISLASSAARLFHGAIDVTAEIPHALVFSLSTSDTYLVFFGGTGAAPAPVDIQVTTTPRNPTVRDPLTGATERLVPSHSANTPPRFTMPLTGHPRVLDFNFGDEAPSLTTEAQRTVLPSVEEIIARQQQVQTTQDGVVHNYVAHSRIELHFHVSAADPAYNVVTENQLFADRSGVEWAQSSFSMNGATWTKNPPAFPLLQPEKVLSLPLDLRLNQDYRYRLDGVETVDGHEAFVVRFDPVDRSRSLYQGTLWIDRATFVRLKVSAVETHLSGTVGSNEEVQTFTQVADLEGHAVWLPTDLTSRQTVLVAGRTVLVERAVRLTDVRVNAPDFESTRTEARGSDDVMYRDTDQGLRYFVKQGNTRVVSDKLATSVRAFVMGADIDPSFDYPLPIGGLDIIDFNFLHRDLQLALLFGGVIAFGNVQRAGLWGGRVDASIDFFGLALKSNDSVFDGAGERRGERVLTRPFSVGGNLGYRISSFQKISGQYEIRRDEYFRDPQTTATFVVPSSTTTRGEGGSYEYRRRGYSFAADGMAYQRSTWTPWGAGSDFEPADRTYTRYDAGLSKDFVFATFHTIHLNGEYFGGQRLDRFSMYQFGLFDATRMHGVPSAVRFGELAMFRGSYSFNLFDQYRLDLFVDQAVGRDTHIDDRWRPVTGLGASVNWRGPRSTIVKIDFGRSVLPALYRGAGSTVVQIMILKPL